jgi:dolichyl-phosphate beta-glucosyltransferase
MIIPCYNEVERLQEEVVRSFAEKNPDIHLLLIDDCSRDGTRAMLDRIEASAVNGNVTALGNPVNLGKAETIRSGVQKSHAFGDFTHLAFWDADLSTPLEEIQWFYHFLETFPEKKLFFGSRWMRLGATIHRKFSRQLLGRVFASAVSLMLDLPVYDTQCGAKVIERDTALMCFDKPFVSKWFFDVELIMRYMKVHGRTKALLDVYEVPLQTWIHMEGSKLKVKDYFNTPIELYKIRNAYR